MMLPNPVSARLMAIAGCLLLTLAISVLCSTVNAQGQDENDEYLLSESTYNTLSKINELLEAEKYSEALNRLQSLKQDVEGDDYEEAVVQQTLGYTYNGLQRYDQAAGAFINAVESDALPNDVSHRLQYFIAQLLAQVGDYKRAIEYLEIWLAEETSPDADNHRLAAGLYYETGNYKQVIKHARAAINKSTQANENLYQLLLASYFETRDYNSAAGLLQDMLQLFPDNKNYWKQLYSTYQLLDQGKKALAVYELAYRRGFLNPDEKEELARLYLHLEAPFRAARFLQEEMDNGEIARNAENLKLLAESYYLAQETDKAIETYGEAANISGDGNLYFRQGQLLTSQQRWEPAQTALRNALKTDTLKHRAQAQLLLGIAAFKLENNQAATEALQQATRDKATREQAEYWLQQIKQRS